MIVDGIWGTEEDTDWVADGVNILVFVTVTIFHLLCFEFGVYKLL